MVGLLEAKENIHNVDMNSNALRIHIFADANATANSFPFLNTGQETAPRHVVSMAGMMTKGGGSVHAYHTQIQVF